MITDLVIYTVVGVGFVGGVAATSSLLVWLLRAYPLAGLATLLAAAALPVCALIGALLVDLWSTL